MGLYEGESIYILEILELKGFACKAKCRSYSTGYWSTDAIKFIEYHPTFLYYKIVPKRDDENEYQTCIDDESFFYRKYFKTEKIFDDWMQVNLPMKKLIGN